MESKKWSLNTRFLHLGMVATISAQLFISLVMSEPDDIGTVFGKLAYEAHEVVGLTALGIVILHWIWSMLSHTDGKLKHLFPWRGEARKQVVQDVKLLTRGQLPDSKTHGGLAGLIHGLGFLAVTGAAITGAILFVTFPESGEPGVIAEAFAELHEGMAGLVWAYWLGHGGVAILHHLSGSDVLNNMFSAGTNKHSSHRKESVQCQTHGTQSRTSTFINNHFIKH